MKISYGIGLDIFQTKLNNVDREKFSGYGHSVPGFKQNDRLGFGLTFLASKPIYKNLSFETGLGGTNFNSQFHFNYVDTISNNLINTMLNISLYYAEIPFYLTYNVGVSTKSILNFSLGTDVRFLILGQDNYQEIISQFILLPKARYNFFIPSVEAKLGYTLKSNIDKNFRLEAFAGIDLKNTVGHEK